MNIDKESLFDLSVIEGRIKFIRKKNNLNQSDFGKQVGVKGNTIGNYEVGLRKPSDAVILSISREFGINESWIRTGEGEMFAEMSQAEKAAGIVGRLLQSDNEFIHKALTALGSLTEKEWEVIEKLVDKIKADEKK